MHFHSIRLMKLNQNYRLFVRALTIFNKAMNGLKTNVGDIRKTDSLILLKLIEYRLKQKNKGKFPDYILKIFNQFCNNKSQITINTTFLHLQFAKVMKTFVKHGSFPLLNNIAKLFPNCNEIHIRTSNTKIELSTYYLDNLTAMITKLNKIKGGKPRDHWKYIVLHDIEKKDITECDGVFRGIGWKIRITKSTGWSKDNLLLEPWLDQLEKKDHTSVLDIRYHNKQKNLHKK